MVESWLKWARPIGSTASWAAALTARAPARPRRGSGASTMPAVAANESWKPGSCRSAGRAARMTSAARARLFSTAASRSSSKARSTSTAISVARSTEGWDPTTDGESDHHDQRSQRRQPPRRPGQCQQSPHGGGHQRHVEARDRQHVVDARAAESRVDVGRQIGALAQEQPRHERGRHRRQRLPHGVDRAPAQAHRPRGLASIERGDALGAHGADDLDAVPAQSLGVVVGAGVAEADRPVEPCLDRDPLARRERRAAGRKR